MEMSIRSSSLASSRVAEEEEEGEGGGGGGGGSGRGLEEEVSWS